MPLSPSRPITESNVTEEDFLAAYDKYNDAIFRFLYFRLGERELATDLTQETFTKVWKYVVNGKDIKHLQAFLYTTARHLVIDQVRKKKEISLDNLMAEGFEPGLDETDKHHMAIDVKMLLDAVTELNESYAEVLKLRYIDGLGPKDIAPILNESENVISVRLNRGLKFLREIINKNI